MSGAANGTVVAELCEALRGLLEIVCDDCKSWLGNSREDCIGCFRVKAARAALARAEKCDGGESASETERLRKLLDYCVRFIGNAAEPLGADSETVRMIGEARALLAEGGAK